MNYIAVIIAALGAVELTAEEIDALFSQNVQKASTIRVDWRRTWVYSDAWRDYTVRNAAVIQRDLDAGKYALENRDVMQKMADRSREATVPAARTLMQDYWSDRDRFQWRVINSSAAGFEFYGNKPPRVSHPDVESTPEGLLTSLRESLIVTGGGHGIPLRTWFGGKQSGSRKFHSGAVSFEIPLSRGMLEYFPPFALPEADWPGLPSRIDQFARPEASRRESVGEYRIGSVMTQVIVKAWPRRPSSHRPSQKDWDVVRAFVDVERAAIPLRLEGFVFKAEDLEQIFRADPAPQSGESRPFPAWIVRDVEVREVSPGFLYPVRGFVDEMGPSPDSAGGRPTKLVPHEIIEWQVFRVEPDRLMSKDNFDMSFPPNTLIRDERTNESRLTGSLDDHSELIINRVFSSREKQDHLSSVGQWLAILGAGAIAFFGVRWIAKTRRS